jgi:hypothetical protein
MPAEYLGKTTRLHAVNQMLRSLGESPVADLANPKRSDVVAAIDELDSSNRYVQSEGWWFNSDVVTYEPDTNSNILIVDEILSVDLYANDLNKLVTEREGKLYNLSDNTFQFTTKVKLDIIRLLPFESLPEVARRYITCRASRLLMDSRVGDPQLRQFLAQDESIARYELESFENENGDYNVFTGALYRLINPDWR